MSVEHDILRQINFDDFTNGFANAKARKDPGFLWTLRDSVPVCVCNFLSFCQSKV